MDQNWNDLVEEGKELAARKDKNQWHLGELAAKVEKDYGKNSLGRYASEIGEHPTTLIGYRTTFRAWPDENIRPRIFSLAKDLCRHPDRVKIIQNNPNIIGTEARALMKEWREAKRADKTPKRKRVDPATPLNNRRQIEAEIERRVAERVDDWMGKFKPHLDEAKAVKAGRKGLIGRDEAAAIKRCLHPDNSASQEMRNKAFVIWRRIEHLLMSEQDAPTVIECGLRRKRRGRHDLHV